MQNDSAALAIKNFDIYAELQRHLLVVVFMKSNSVNYPLAVEVAKTAGKYAEVVVAGKLTHFAAFSRDRDSAAGAQLLIDYIRDWKSTKVFAGAQLSQRIWRVDEVLRCFMSATACNDWKAYCHSVIDDPANKGKLAPMTMTIKIAMPGEIPVASEPQKEPDKYIFPCRLIRSYNVIDHRHPSSAIDQIEAAAIEHGCEWCPYFDAAAYRRLQDDSDER